ncbi:hypothetical protein [Pseudomonas sp. 9AZ]|uniref:hypothetical protein n=1 Tax=Pseudomonas sp. 9AZ TaxID=2653168 RepID=UPI00135B6475|nr:hypothetical protein [Pseudomonas sp. 9AZ]
MLSIAQAKRIDVYINDRLSILWKLQQMRSEGIFASSGLNRLVESPTLSSEHGSHGLYTYQYYARLTLAAALTMAQQAVTTSDQHQLPKAVHARTLRAFFL